MPIIKQGYPTARARNKGMDKILGCLSLCSNMDEFNITLQEVNDDIEMVKDYDVTVNQMAESYPLLQDQIELIKQSIQIKEHYNAIN